LTPKLDTLHAFETPEGVELGLRVAGPLPRALAWAIDAAVRYTILAALMVGVAWLADLGMGLFLIALFAMEWFYPVVFEVTQGRTPGKKAMGLAVVHDNGTPIGWPASLIRNLLRTIDFFPAFYGAGLVTMLVNRRFQRLGDLAAGTLVIYTEPTHHRRAAPTAPPLPPPVSLAVEEQRALLDFAERSGRLSPARVEELAGIIAPQPGPEAVPTVLGYAQWVAHGQ
jgi:uncharacterized RDD family membrane protein YckC